MKFFGLGFVNRLLVRIFTNIMENERVKPTVITEEQQRFARLAKALSHPVRVYIMEFLSEQTCCYSGNLSDILPIAKSTLSQHLKELKDAGLIQGTLEAPKIRYCLNQPNCLEAQKLMKEFWEIYSSFFLTRNS